MLIKILKTLFTRDLTKLRLEKESYNNEENIWKIEKQIANSAGNLCLHLVGNLSTFIGREIGKTNYVRDREAEFSLKNIPRIDLIASISETIEVVNSALDNLTEEDLNSEYPILVFENKMTTMYFLMHLATHLSYHLGQVNYHRRLIDA